MARPQKELNEEEILKLAQIGCTYPEIAEWFNVSVDTLVRRYQHIIKQGHTKMKMSIRRKQLEVAMTGNVGMLIWLGKQVLGQKEPKDSAGEDSMIPDGIEFVPHEEKDSCH